MKQTFTQAIFTAVKRMVSAKCVMAFIFLFSFITNSSFSQSITLTTTLDENNGVTTSIAALIGTPGGAGISLREAILAANNEPNGSVVTITMPAGTFNVTIAGAAENLGVSGDIDVNVLAVAGMKTVTINGAGAGSTIITGSTGERVFDVHAVSNPGSITFNLSGVTISGTILASGSGPAMQLGRAGDISNISNCVFSGNSAPNSGAITQSSSLVAHDLTVTNCTFTNNTATTGGPGALNYNGIGNVTITGCTFSGNTATTQGGAINITGGGSGPVTTNILRNTFLNNTANGTQFGGAAVSIVNAQTVNINFNRLINNTSPNLNIALPPNNGDGRVITAAGGVIGTLNVDNNWWGVNTGPVTTATSRSVFGATPTRWLNLRNTASPSPICVGAISTITASFLINNLSEAIGAGNLTTFIGQPITFNAPVSGTLSSAQTTIQASGTATVTFTATSIGAGSANAVFVPLVENFTVTTSPTITINQTSTSPTGATGTTTICNGGSTTLTVTGGIKGTGAVTQWFTGSCGGTLVFTGDVFNTGVLVATTTYFVRYNGTCNTTTCASVTVTVNQSSVAPTGATGTTTICIGGTTTLTVAGGSKGTAATTQWFTGSCGGTLVFTGDVFNTGVLVATTTYFVRYTGTCNTTTCASVTVIVSPNNTITFSSGFVNQTKTVGMAITTTNWNTTGATGATFAGLPPGVTGNWAANVASISGTVTTIGTYNYTVNLTGGCNAGSTGGQIIVSPSLPVTLTSFTGKLNPDKTVTLQWKVEAQQDIQEYIVEESSDAIVFSPLGSVPAGTGTVATYSLIDRQVATGNNYYRLKIVELSGKISYSNIVLVNLKAGITVLIYPNPLIDNLTIQQFGVHQNKTALLTDEQGKILKQIRLTNLLQELNMTGYPAGIYILKMEDGTVLKLLKL